MEMPCFNFHIDFWAYYNVYIEMDMTRPENFKSRNVQIYLFLRLFYLFNPEISYNY